MASCSPHESLLTPCFALSRCGLFHAPVVAQLHQNVFVLQVLEKHAEKTLFASCETLFPHAHPMLGPLTPIPNDGRRRGARTTPRNKAVLLAGEHKQVQVADEARRGGLHV